MMRRVWLPALAGAVVLLVVTAIWFVPFVTRSRPVHASTPTPPPLFQTAQLRLGARDRLCVSRFVITPEHQVVRIVPVAGTRAPRLDVELTAPGYRAAVTARDFAIGQPLDLRVPAPQGEGEGRLCLANESGPPVAFAATVEARSRSRAVTVVNGQTQDAELVLSFFEAEPGRLAGNADKVARRAAAFRPAPIGPWIFWLLAPLVLIGVPWLVLRSLKA